MGRVQQVQRDSDGNLHVYYGTNEVGLITLARPADLQASAQTVGTVVAGVRVQVVDAVDTPLPAGSIGQVRLQSPGLADGYHDNPQADSSQLDSGSEPFAMSRTTIGR